MKQKVKPYYAVAKKQKGKGKMAMLNAAIRCCENGSVSAALGCLLMLKSKMQMSQSDQEDQSDFTAV